MPLNRRSVAVVDAGGLCLAPGEQAIVPVAWDRAVPSDDFWCEESSLSGVTVQSGLCPGGVRKLMMCVTNESELEYSLERGLPLAEAFDWVCPPKVSASDTVAVSKEVCRGMAPEPRGADQLVMEVAAASRILNLAQRVFDPDGTARRSAGLDLAAIGLVLGDRIPEGAARMSGYPLPACQPGVLIPAEQDRREALAELNLQLSSGALQKRWWSSL